jgi:acetyltransferase-like isoleucine patch superfamily enzyme
MQSKKPLVFLGTRQSIKFVQDIAERNGYQILGILDDQYAGDHGQNFANTDIPILGSELDLDRERGNREISDLVDTADFFIVTTFMGTYQPDKIKRAKLFVLADRLKLNLVNLIDPESRILPDVALGRNIIIGYNCYVCGDCSIGTGSTLMAFVGLSDQVKIGTNCMIGTYSTFGTGTVIGDDCVLGMRTSIGRTLKSAVTVGNNCMISNSGTIYRNIPDNKWLLPNGKMVNNDDAGAGEIADTAYFETTFVTRSGLI